MFVFEVLIKILVFTRKNCFLVNIYDFWGGGVKSVTKNLWRVKVYGMESEGFCVFLKHSMPYCFSYLPDIFSFILLIEGY